MFAADRHDPEALPRAVASVVGTGLLCGFMVNGIAVIYLMGGLWKLLLWVIATFFGPSAALWVNDWAYPAPSPVGEIAELDLALGAPLADLPDAGYSEPPMPGEPPNVKVEEPPEEPIQMDGIAQLLAMTDVDATFGDVPIEYTGNVMITIDSNLGNTAFIDNVDTIGAAIGGGGEIGGVVGGTVGGYGANGAGGGESWPELLGNVACKAHGQCCIVTVDVDPSGKAVDADAVGCDGRRCTLDCAESAALAAHYVPAHDADGVPVMGATSIVIE